MVRSIIASFLVALPLLFISSQYNALMYCRKEHRLLQPGMVWLEIVPVVLVMIWREAVVLASFAWFFIVAVQIHVAQRAEFASRGQARAYTNVLYAGLGNSLALALLAGQKYVLHSLGMKEAKAFGAPLCGVVLISWTLYWGLLALNNRRLAASPSSVPEPVAGWHEVGGATAADEHQKQGAAPRLEV